MAANQGRAEGPARSRPRLVLASSSPRRRELLAMLAVPFEVVPPRIDESSARGSGREVAVELARRKAERVLAELPPRRTSEGSGGWVVLGADTVVCAGEEAGAALLGKPSGAGQAREMLRRLSGRSHQVWTGVAVAAEGLSAQVEAECTRVTFRELAAADIERYLASGDYKDKAGAYGIQGAAASLVEGIEGCYFNVIGLPLVRTARLLGGIAPSFACECGRHALQRGAPGCAFSAQSPSPSTAWVV